MSAFRNVLVPTFKRDETAIVKTRSGATYTITRGMDGWYYSRHTLDYVYDVDLVGDFTAEFTEKPPVIVDGRMHIGGIRTTEVVGSSLFRSTRGDAPAFVPGGGV